MFKSSSFDVVLTDICMPIMTGNGLYQHIRAIDPNIPIIEVTSDPELATEDFCFVERKPLILASFLKQLAQYAPRKGGGFVWGESTEIFKNPAQAFA